MNPLPKIVTENGVTEMGDQHFNEETYFSSPKMNHILFESDIVPYNSSIIK